MRAIDSKTSRAALAHVYRRPTDGRGGVSMARFAGLDADGHFQVELSDGSGVRRAVSTVTLGAGDIGAAVVVAHDHHDPERPIIVGRALEGPADVQASVVADGGRLVIRAEQEIELRCGDASIVLTRAGKVLIRGNYVLTRSRGANKIKGAFVDIN